MGMEPLFNSETAFRNNLLHFENTYCWQVKRTDWIAECSNWREITRKYSGRLQGLGDG